MYTIITAVRILIISPLFLLQLSATCFIFTSKLPPMSRIIFALFCALLLFPALTAQNVGINDDGDLPHHSAMLDVRSTNKGMLVPRLDIVQRDSIHRPATGLLIYQTDSIPGFYYFDKVEWIRLGEGTAKVLGDVWDTDGNLHSDSAEFLGTTNNYNVIIKTNNTEKMRITNTGRVGINVPYPAAALHVKQAWSTMIGGGGGVVVTGSNIGIRVESFQSSVIVGSGQYNPNKWDISSNISSLRISNPITNNNAITILNNGNIGFGIGAPKTKLHVNGKVLIGAVNVLPSSPYANYMLAVRGTVIAQKYVASLEDWPDYVFECIEEQPTLDEQKAYWQTNNHLLGVPSREEILKDGASLGDLQINIMEKLEQAYLYIDQLNQRIIELENKMKALEKK